jgi:hypothetical protein
MLPQACTGPLTEPVCARQVPAGAAVFPGVRMLAISVDSGAAPSQIEVSLRIGDSLRIERSGDDGHKVAGVLGGDGLRAWRANARKDTEQ